MTNLPYAGFPTAFALAWQGVVERYPRHVCYKVSSNTRGGRSAFIELMILFHVRAGLWERALKPVDAHHIVGTLRVLHLLVPPANVSAGDHVATQCTLSSLLNSPSVTVMYVRTRLPLG